MTIGTDIFRYQWSRYRLADAMAAMLQEVRSIQMIGAQVASPMTFCVRCQGQGIDTTIGQLCETCGGSGSSDI
jgi:hypothetical protein